MSIKGEDESDAQAKYLANFDMPPLTVDEMEDLSSEQIDEYNEEMVFMAKMKEDVAKAWDKYDHYHEGMRILDTDYDSYMLLYHCREEFPDLHFDEYRYDRALETHDQLEKSEKFIKFRDDLKKSFDLEERSEEEFE